MYGLIGSFVLEEPLVLGLLAGGGGGGPDCIGGGGDCEFDGCNGLEGGDDGLNFCRQLDKIPLPGLPLESPCAAPFPEISNSCCERLTFSLISCCSWAACASRSAFC